VPLRLLSYHSVTPSSVHTLTPPPIQADPVKKAAAYDAARAKYSDALTNLGYQADLQHNVALCYYKNKQYGPALKCIAEIIEKVREGGGARVLNKWREEKRREGEEENVRTKKSRRMHRRIHIAWSMQACAPSFNHCINFELISSPLHICGFVWLHSFRWAGCESQRTPNTTTNTPTHRNELTVTRASGSTPS